MLLRSGIILPFQFRDHKKLLMVGGPEENRDLNLWDLKNVVRAAFGIYNFEFRNKKIDFNIPDDLLLRYLAQRHDLTNFVIEIRQATDEAVVAHTNATSAKELCLTSGGVSILANSNALSFEPSCSIKQQIVTTPQKSSDSASDVPPHGSNYARSPLDISSSNNSDHSSNHEPPQKIRIAQEFSEHTAESMTQSLDPMDIMPKSEHDDNDMIEVKCSVLQQHAQQQQQQQHQQQQHQQHQQHQSHQLQQQSSFFPNYAAGNGSIGGIGGMLSNATLATHSPQYPPGMINRFRRRGERMSKDQKEIYVKYFEENPCMLTQRRNDIVLEPHWNKLAALLNSVPQGAVKNVEEWKQTFDAWRYRVFMYTRYNSKLIGAAAQNPKNYKPLTATDQRAYAMWTSHKNTTPPDFEKMDMFANLEETQTDYDY